MNEFELIKKYAELKCSSSLGVLLERYLPLIKRIAGRYWACGYQLDELVHEGVIGFCKAIQSYSSEKECRSFARYSFSFIQRSILDFVISNGRVIKMISSPSQKKVVFNIRKMTDNLGFLSRDEIARIANELEVSFEDVVVAENYMTGRDIHYCEANLSDGFTNTELVWLNFEALYVDDVADELIELNYDAARLSALSNSLPSLNERELHIIKTRWLNDKKATLKELSKELSVSSERIRQLEDKAMGYLKVATEYWMDSHVA